MTTTKHSIIYSTTSNVFHRKSTNQTYMIPLHMQPLPILPTLLYLFSTFDSCLKTSTNRTPSHTPSSTHADTILTCSSYKNHGLIVLELTSRQVSTKLECQITPNSIISYRISLQNTNRMLQHIFPNITPAGPSNPDQTLSLIHLSDLPPLTPSFTPFLSIWLRHR